MKLAILTPTLEDGATVNTPGGVRVGNAELLNRMQNQLREQARKVSLKHEVQLFINVDRGEKTTGYKRNALMEAALLWGADAHAFFDDDDLPGATYIERGIEFMESGMDVAELWGQIYWSGVPGKPFHHSIEVREWYEDNDFYYRMPNHLNFVKTSLVKDIKFPDQVFGEDGKWSYALRDAGLLKTEFKIPEIMYHYFCGNPKHRI